MKFRFFLFAMVVGAPSSGQDLLMTTSGDTIQAKVKEVSETTVTYLKSNNLSGPTYSKMLTNIVEIKYENGSTEKYNTKAAQVTEGIKKIPIGNAMQFTAKGNNVFIEIRDEASRAGEKYFVDALEDWGYWHVVKEKEQSHFIIEFNVDKKIMLDKTARLTFKTCDGVEFLKSDFYRASTSAFNGYNAFRAVANKIVDKFLKKKFNQ